jgi:hypothetical protein
MKRLIMRLSPASRLVPDIPLGTLFPDTRRLCSSLSYEKNSVTFVL